MMKAWGFGGWTTLAIPNNIQKRLYKYLLKKAIGQFLANDLDLDSFDIQLSKGTVELRDLELNVQALNELIADLPLVILDGRITAISASIPWTNFWSGDCELEIRGLRLTVGLDKEHPGKAKPKPPVDDEDPYIMSSSIHIAGDFLRHEVPPDEDEELRNSIYQSFHSAADGSGSLYYGTASSMVESSMDSLPPRPSVPSQPSTPGGMGPPNVDTGLEGLQVLSRLIDKIMAKVKVEVRDTLLRVHHRSELNLGGRNGTNHFAFSSFGGLRRKKDYYVDFSIPLISYRDETPGLNDDNAQTFPTTPAPMGSSSIMLPPVANDSIKVVSIASPTVWIREGEGAVRAEDTGDAVSIEDEDEGKEFSDSEDVSLGEDMDGVQRESSNQTFGTKRQSSPNNTRSFYSALIFSTLDQNNWIRLKLRPTASPEYEASNVYMQQNTRQANVEIEAFMASICTVLCPEQVVFLSELAMAMGSVGGAAEAKQAPPTTEVGRAGVGLDDMEELDLGLRSYPSREPARRSSADQARYSATQQGMHKDMPGGFGSEPLADRRRTGTGQYDDSFGGGAPVRSPFKTPTMQQPPRRSPGGTGTGSSAGLTSSAGTGRSLVPALRIKFQIQMIECFFLYRDPEGDKDIPKEDEFFKMRSPESLETDHLKLEIGNLVIRYHDWGDGGKNGAKRRSEGIHSTVVPHRSSSSSRSASYSSRPTAASNTPSSSRKSAPYTSLEIVLTTFYITEWLACPPPGTPAASPDGLDFDSTTATNPTGEGRKTTQGSRPMYRVYNPILEFDNDLPQSYDQGGVDAADFPTFLAVSPREARRARQSQQAAMGPPPKSGSTKAGMREVVKVRFEKGDKDGAHKDASGSSASSTSASAPAHRYDQDINIELRPFHIHVDVRMVDRLEHYLTGLMGLMATNGEDGVGVEPVIRHDILDDSPGQLIINDLDDQGVIQNSPTLTSRIRVRCGFMRIWFVAPDMNKVNLRDEITDSIHAELLILDIVKFTISSITSVGTGATHGSPLYYERLHNQNEMDTEGGEKKLRKAKVECGTINLFLKYAEELTALCWLTIKPAQVQQQATVSSSPSRTSPASSTLPNIEITFRPPEVASSKLFNFDTSGGASSAIGGMASSTTTTASSTPFPQLFSTFEGEQRVRTPAEDEEEEIMMFRQRTIETSLLVANCHFPITRLHLTKRAWDTIQIIQNDLQVWQPRFIATAAAAEGAAIEASIHSDHGWSSPQDKYSRRRSTNDWRQGYDEESSDSMMHGGGHRRRDRNRAQTATSVSVSEERFVREVSVKPTLLSLVVFMVVADFVFDITPAVTEAEPKPTAHLYELGISELRWFSVVKHEGKDHDSVYRLYIAIIQNDSIVCFDMEDFTLKDVTNQAAIVPLFYRTISKSIKTKFNKPMFSLVSHLSVNSDLNMQEKNTNIVITGVTWQFAIEADFIKHLLEFQQVPEDMIYVDLPSQYTKVFVTVNDTSVDYKPFNMPSRAIVVVDNVKVTTTIIPDSPTQGVKVLVENINALLVDDVRILNERGVITSQEYKPFDAYRYWRTAGFANVLSMKFLEITVKINKGERTPNFELELTNQALNVEACADSWQTVLELISYMASAGDIPEERRPQPKKPATQDENRPKLDKKPEEIRDKMADVDESAFGRRESIKVAPDPMDDLSNLSFVEEFYPFGDKSMMLSESRMITHAVPPKKPKRKVGIYVSSEDTIRLLEPEMVGLEIVENHFAAPNEDQEDDVSSKDLPNSLMRIRMKDFNITLKLYDGFDWEKTRDEMRDRLQKAKVQAKRIAAAEAGEPMTRENSNNSLSPPFFDPQERPHLPSYIGSDYGGSQPPSEADYLNDDQSDTASQVSSRVDFDTVTIRDGKRPDPHYQPQQRHNPHHRRSRFKRSSSSKMEFRIERLGIEFDMFPAEEQIASRLLVTVRDFEIIDNVRTSLWRKFLSHMRPDSDTSPREAKSNMVRFELNGVRPKPSESAEEEYRLKAKLLPMRLYVDQDALTFLIRFFSFGEIALKATKPTPGPAVSNDEDPFFFQHVEVQPISIKLDYKPKHVDYNSLKEGKFVELMNFFHLDSAEMTLRTVKLTGVKGWARLIEGLSNEWVPHIKNTQLPNMVSGVAPLRSLVNVGSGVADLVLLPFEQYKKDGRIIKGLQKGTQSFAKATTMEAIKLGTKLAAGTQIILEHADEMLGGNSGISGSNRVLPEDDDEDSDKQEVLSKFAEQPADFTEGLEFAYKSLSRNIGTAAQTIYAVPMEVYERDGPSGSVRAVVRAVPVAVLKPMIGITEALSNVLLGLRNTIDPNKKLQNEDKYKRG